MWRLPCALLFGCSLVIDSEGPDQDATLVRIDAARDAVADMCGVERCNGIDDDCDDVVDEGEGGPLQQACYPFDDGEPGTGVCTAGVAPCEEGAFGLCEDAVGPSPEQDNGLDDDCDGASDEA